MVVVIVSKVPSELLKLKEKLSDKAEKEDTDLQ